MQYWGNISSYFSSNSELVFPIVILTVECVGHEQKVKIISKRVKMLTLSLQVTQMYRIQLFRFSYHILIHVENFVFKIFNNVSYVLVEETTNNVFMKLNITTTCVDVARIKFPICYQDGLWNSILYFRIPIGKRLPLTISRLIAQYYVVGYLIQLR